MAGSSFHPVMKVCGSSLSCEDLASWRSRSWSCPYLFLIVPSILLSGEEAKPSEFSSHASVSSRTRRQRKLSVHISPRGGCHWPVPGGRRPGTQRSLKVIPVDMPPPFLSPSGGHSVMVTFSLKRERSSLPPHTHIFSHLSTC
jgi:hypothetical protein